MKYTQEEIKEIVDLAKEYIAIFSLSEMAYTLANKIVMADTQNDLVTLEKAIEYNQEAHFIETAIKNIKSKRSMKGNVTK